MIIFDNVSKQYPDGVWALRDVNLTIDDGEFVSLVGHSGAGKSSFLKLLWAELKPTAGRLVVDGQDLAKMNSGRLLPYRQDLGVVFQDYRLLPNRTVFENVAFALEVAGSSDSDIREDVPYALQLVGLHDQGERFPGDLSAGEQQRLAIARAIVRQPDILLADEPTGNLDPQATHDIMQILKKVNDIGTTVILATHSHTIVDSLGRRVLTLESGQVIHDEAKGGYRGSSKKKKK